MVKERRIWTPTGSFSLPPVFLFLLHRHCLSHTCQLCGNAFPSIYPGAMTDEHLRHLSGPIVRAAYRTAPSSRTRAVPRTAHIVAAPSAVRAGGVGRRGASPCVALWKQAPSPFASWKKNLSFCSFLHLLLFLTPIPK